MTSSTVICFFLIAEIFYILITYYYLHNSLVDKNRYRLFAVRDQFVRLVITKHLNEDDDIYTFFIAVINTLIRNTQKIQLLTLFIYAVRRSFVQDEKTFDTFIEKVKTCGDKEIMAAVSSLIVSITLIFLDNSLIFRGLIFTSGILTKLNISNDRRPIGVYRDFSNLNKWNNELLSAMAA